MTSVAGKEKASDTGAVAVGDEMLQPSPAEVKTIWQELLTNGKTINLRDSQVLFVAGGVLPATTDGFVPMDELEARSGAQVIEVAGVKFTKEDIKLIREFYQWLVKNKGFTLHCIDERLVEPGDKYLQTGVHENCGACNAVGTATGIEGVEDKLADHHGVLEKQPVYADMHSHASVAINFDLVGARVAVGQERDNLKDANALAFNVSLPVDLIVEYCSTKSLVPGDLSRALIKWSGCIARNIIAGDHNDFSESANQTLIILNRIGLDSEYHSLASIIEGQIRELVVHGDELYAK